ncbi:multicopper oxidase family protein [Pseudoxanthobacter sp. M-2]|uniref:multicopper oxidase family protein n=1 Tax=Pseudoxanthobacter sp. M-2 TaxID=3078754 RepID=UPI0038FC580D
MMLRPTRRSVVLGGLAGLTATILGWRSTRAAGPPPLARVGVMPQGREVPLSLVAAERSVTLPAFGGRAMPLMTFFEGDAFPQVVRIRRGDTLVTTLDNRLPAWAEEMSVHWHGLRIPNAEDGVPYLTQKPVPPGGTYGYRFAPPDAGTFWFHTHCNTAETLGRGLLGVLIAEGDETVPYDADVLVCLKDWRIGEDGAFLPFLTDEGAARAGSFGTVRSANGEAALRIDLPAGGDCRLRVLNVDPTRIPEIGVEGAEAAVVAIDGVAVPPFPLRSWRLGPAMRLDLVVRAPAAGREARLVDYHAPQPVTLATLSGTGDTRRTGTFQPAPLLMADLAEPDLANALPLTLTFSATATGASVAEIAGDAEAPPLGPLCVTDRSFWAINREPWPDGGHARLPPPLAVLERGRTYRLTLHNVTPHPHPIHIHGHFFRVLSSSRREIVPHWADTVLLTPKERLEVALVADNPGDWMLHCHIIEHQETGMMGFVRVM